MGKGTIASGGTDGLYQVTLDYGQAARDARVARITAELAALVGKIADAQALLDAQQAVEDAQKAVVQGAIAAYVAASHAVGPALAAVNAALAALAEVQADALATPEELAAAQATLSAANDAYAGAKSAIEPALKTYTEAAAELATLKGKTAALRLPLELLKAQQVQQTKDLATWTALVLTETVPAWCADLTEDASGEVATVEIPGENKLVLIAPAAPAPGPADGLLTAREVQSPEQAFWNAAVLPGWQKWKPTYRRGTITAIDYDADTASVTLFDDVSSAQNLPINQSANLTAVPVDYMQCDAEAFDVGDVVVVKFTGQDWANPRVIGFCDNPKECPGQAGWSVYGAGALYKGSWSRGSSDGPYEWNRYSRPGYGGNVSYSSALGVVSWWGQAGICSGGLLLMAAAAVYYRGTSFSLAGNGGIVRGATLVMSGGVKYIISIVLLGYENAYRIYKTNPKTGESSVIATIDVPAGELGAYLNGASYYFATTPIFFDVATGLKGATLVYNNSSPSDGRPRTCEYVINADLTGVTRTLGEPLSIGHGITTGGVFTDLFRVYLAAFYDAGGALQTAYYEVSGGGNSKNVSFTGSVIVGGAVWWSGSYDTGYTDLGGGYWKYEALVDGLVPGRYSASMWVYSLDPRYRNSLMVSGFYGGTTLDGVPGGTWTWDHTATEKLHGADGALLLAGTAIYGAGNTPAGGWGSASATCEGERTVGIVDGWVLQSARATGSTYGYALAASGDHIVRMAMINKDGGGHVYKLIADDFSEAGFLAASGLSMPDDALFTSPRIYFGVMT